MEEKNQTQPIDVRKELIKLTTLSLIVISLLTLFYIG